MPRPPIIPAAGAFLALLSLCLPGLNAQSSQDATRLPDGTQPPKWEQPLQFSKTWYVNGNAANASDTGPGTQQQPFRTVGKAAQVLQPGERVVIAEGVYRESVHPERGGSGPGRMISYEAALGAKVVIKGSVVVRAGWEPSTGFRAANQGDVNAKIYQVHLDPKWFDGYNPFLAMNMPSQRWQYMNRMSLNVHNILVPYTRRRGMVFVDGKPVEQMRAYSELTFRNPSWASPSRGEPYSEDIYTEIGGAGKFYVTDDGLTLHVRFPNDDSPDKHVVEITNREQVFAPVNEYLGYIRVKGITFQHAGNGFPVPQRGMVSATRGHHWIFEDNTIEWANSIGLDVGRQYFEAGQSPGPGGNHIIRRNVVRYCGIGGIEGVGAPNLDVENNLVEWVGWQDAEHMSESAGFKFHNAVDLLFANNVIRHMRHAVGIWLDVGNINCRLTRNVFADIYSVHGAIWIEASHQQDQIDDNIISGVRAAENVTAPGVETGGAAGVYILGTDKLIVAQNLFMNIAGAGVHVRMEEERLIGTRGGTTRDERVYNNIFYDCAAAVEFANEFNSTDGNLYARLPGGYLSILYPGRRERLDLDAWREFYGWDKQGRMAQMDASLDPDSLLLKVSVRGDVPPVKLFNNINTDFFEKTSGDTRLPGPFSDLSDAAAKGWSVDPRHKD